MPLQIEPISAGSIIHIKVVPNSARSAIIGLLGNALKIKVAAPPEDGKANKAVQALLAKAFHVPPTHIEILAGHTHPHKSILLRGIDADKVHAILGV